MIKINDPHYWENASVLRATQAWQQERKTEDKLSKNYQLFLEQIKREIGDLYSQYGEEGLLNYSDLMRQLSSVQLNQYKNMIESIIMQNRDIVDEELLLELNKLTQYSNLNILDSKMNILEAYLLVMVHQNIEMVSEALSATYKETYNHTLYDIHRKFGEVTEFEKVTDENIEEILLLAWTGMTYKEAIKHSRHNFKRDIKLTVAQSIRRNETYQKVIKSLSSLVSGGKGFKSIRTILRDETTRIIGESTAQSYEQAGIEQYQFLATLDNRTTQVCINTDLKVFDLKDREIGVNFAPLHINCRSTCCPYFPEDDLSERQRRARNSSGNNYKISASISYKDWDEKYNK